MMEKILVVVDMQRDFTCPDGKLYIPGAEEMAKDVAEYITKKRDEGYCIVTLRDEHGPEYEHSIEGQLIKPHCEVGTEGFELNPYIKDVINPETDYCITKSTFGTFAMTPDIFGECPERIEIVGVAMDICVLANATILRSMYPNTDIHVIQHLCAATSEVAECATLNALDAQLITVDD